MSARSGTGSHYSVLGLEIGDKVTVERQPPGAGAWVDADLIIQGMQHRIDDEQWRVTLYLSPAPTSSEDAPYLTLGDADDGKIGAADGNLIPA